MDTNPPGKQVIIIAGPTAVGKTALAIRVAKAFGTEIISADSRQCYREMNIGVARPSPEELAEVPHHFIATHSIHEEVTAAVFEEYTLAKTTALFTQHDTVVMTGGTGLYLKAFADGLDPVPPGDPDVRRQILASYETGGLAWLQDELQKNDPLFVSEGEIRNPQRAMRALEVALVSGRSILSFHTGTRSPRGFRIIRTAINLPRETLNQRINDRVNAMMSAGLLEEAQDLYPFRRLNALRTVGYSELFDYIDGNLTLDEATGLIATHSRQYAKRQVTWFRRDPEFRWFTPEDASGIITLAGNNR
ncbi:MAG: tRNA (adenosine(37)-N6)-dimethylallyltransferase MiaA [Chitinophagaceae bacterium]|nr:MAG: tRNA (adenosine(37)-N6)-dimethylallyltransferase MiaA [Chitinophagaceae bacterium]